MATARLISPPLASPRRAGHHRAPRLWAAGVLLLAATAIGATGCSATQESATIDVKPTIDTSSPAYNYFGSVEVAQGSSLDTVIDNVDSSADITVVETPEGVEVTITDADDGSTRIELQIADDAPVGAHAITFDIVGEPEPVNWTIGVLAR